MSLQSVHCSSSSFSPILPSSFLPYISLLPSNHLHSLFVITNPSVSHLAIYQSDRKLIHNAASSFPIPHRSGLQLNPHRWVDIHTHKKKKLNICEEAPACQACSGVNLVNPSHMSHHHIQSHTHTHTTDFLLILHCKHCEKVNTFHFISFSIACIFISILYNPIDWIYRSLQHHKKS